MHLRLFLQVAAAMCDGWRSQRRLMIRCITQAHQLGTRSAHRHSVLALSLHVHLRDSLRHERRPKHGSISEMAELKCNCYGKCDQRCISSTLVHGLTNGGSAAERTEPAEGATVMSVEIKVTRRMRWCMTVAAAPVDCGIGAGEREIKGKEIPRQMSAMADLNDDGHLRAACCPHG